MNRRQLLALLAGVGATTAVPLLKRLSDSEAFSFFLVTDRPDQDLARLLSLLTPNRRRSAQIEVMAIAPAPQDLCLSRGATLADPVREPSVPPALRRLADGLRRRSEPGTSLLSVSDAQSGAADHIAITVSGTRMLELDPNRSYESIEVDGPMGRTRLRLRDGSVTVAQASCRHKTCERIGARRRGRIVCAPNQLVITLPASSPVDALTG